MPGTTDPPRPRRGRDLKDILFGWEPANTRATDVGLLVLRVVTGLALAFLHGKGKVPPSERFVGRVGEMGLPAPELFAWLAAIAEFGGGILLAIGLLTRPAAFLVVGNFVIITLMAHAGDPVDDRESAIMFGTIALLYLLAGPGRYSLDALINRRTR